MNPDNCTVLSIITVVFNGEQHLKDTLESVKAQKTDAVEYIVIDGGSTDGTLEICSNYSDIIDVLISESDKGIYDAMNKGLYEASGKFVAYLNSDDYLVADALGRVLSRLSTEGIDFLYGDLQYINDQHETKRLWVSGHFSTRKLENLWIPPHPSSYVRTDLLRNLGGFNLTYALAADYDLMLKALHRLNKVDYLEGILVRMRLGGATNESWSNIFRQNVEIFRSYHSVYGKYPVTKLLYKLIARLKQFKDS
jgi:glycosyltransferase involved in cell wall biosynthesis